MRVQAFNEMPEAEALQQMISCCHSHHWAQRMLEARPYPDLVALLRCAQTFWTTVGEADLLEAFSGHARIGDLSKLRDKFSRAHAEQGQVVKADETVLQSLLQLNQLYEARYGFIFIVCATGKSASEMLELLQQRLSSIRSTELATAKAEQAKITAIRLNALFDEKAAVTH